MADKARPTASLSGSVDSERKKNKAKIDPRIEQKINELRRKAKEHLSTKQFEEALRCLDIAIELHSTSYKLYRMRSIALSCLQQYEKAAADADRVVELAPHIMDGHYHKGFALFHLKDYAAAAHAFQQGLKLNPTDKTLRQGFWDAIALVSQSRTDTDAMMLESVGSLTALETAAAAIVEATAASGTDTGMSTATGTGTGMGTPASGATGMGRPASGATGMGRPASGATGMGRPASGATGSGMYTSPVLAVSFGDGVAPGAGGGAGVGPGLVSGAGAAEEPSE